MAQAYLKKTSHQTTDLNWRRQIRIAKLQDPASLGLHSIMQKLFNISRYLTTTGTIIKMKADLVEQSL